MNKKQILTIGAISFTVILIFGCVALLFTATRPSSGMQASSQYAYKACRKAMLNKDGYGIWTLQNAKYQRFKAEFEFDDGFNIATCEAIGLGPFWIGTKTMETLVGCMQSLSDTGGTECPRHKFGVTP